MYPKMPELTDAYLAGHAQVKFASSDSWRAENIVDRWLRDNDLYDSKFSNEERKMSEVLRAPRLFIPKVYSAVQRMLVDLLDAYFFDRDEIVGVLDYKGIPADSRLLVKTLLNHRLNGNPIDFYPEAYEVCMDALKNGIGIFKVYPRFKKQYYNQADVEHHVRMAEMRVDDPKFGMMLKMLTGKDKIEDLNAKERRKVVLAMTQTPERDYDVYEPCIEALPYEDVFFESWTSWKDYWKGTIIHRTVRTLDYLKKAGTFKNLDSIVPVPSGVPGDDLVKIQRADDQGYGYTPETPLKVDVNSIRIYEIWTYLDINGDGVLESCCYHMAGDNQPQLVISDVEENTLPYKFSEVEEPRPPIVVGQAFPEAHKFKGKSLPEVMEPLQKETNSQRNQEREAVALALRAPTLVNKSAGVDMMALQNRSMGKVVRGDDISDAGVRVLPTQVPSVVTSQPQARTDRDIGELTSLPGPMYGAPGPKEQSATESGATMQNANKKIAQAIRNIGYTLFLPTFRMLLRLEQKWCSDSYIQAVTGRKLALNFVEGTRPRDYIQGEVGLSVDFGTNKSQQLQRLVAIFERANIANQVTMGMVQAGVVAPPDAKFISVMQIFKRMLPLLGEKNEDEFGIKSKAPAPGPPAAPGVASQPGAAQTNLGTPPGDTAGATPFQ